MSDAKCKGRFGGLLGHKWDHTLDEIPDSAVFFRIDCTRKGCDYSMDGVAYRSILENLPPVMRRHMERIGP